MADFCSTRINNRIRVAANVSVQVCQNLSPDPSPIRAMIAQGIGQGHWMGGDRVHGPAFRWSVNDRDCFAKVLQDVGVNLLRPRTYFRHVYTPLCTKSIIVDTPGWRPAHLATPDYRNASRSSIPLSDDAENVQAPRCRALTDP